MKRTAVLAIVMLGVAGVVQGEINWDILNQSYGNGAGQVSFNAQYTMPAGWGGAVPAEALSDGYATLTIPAGTASSYPAISAIAGMPSGSLPVTIEFKVRNRNNTAINFYISQSSDRYTSVWNHILQINRYYNTDEPNSLGDYNLRDAATNFAPAGFDGSTEHVYRLVHDMSGTRVFVDGGEVSVATLTEGIGAAGDGFNLMWGLVPDASADVMIDVYYLRIANGAYALGKEWNILDQNYGSGLGQISFNDQYVFKFGSTALAETLSDGFSTLAIPAGSGWVYPCIDSINGMPITNTAVTIECKLRTRSNLPVLLGISNTNGTPAASWCHFFQVNEVYDVFTPNALCDYNLRTEAYNLAPAGFDGSAEHVYRFVHDASTTGTRVYVDNNAVPLTTLRHGAGSAGDGTNLEWGFAKDPVNETLVDMYYLRARDGAFPVFQNTPITVPEIGPVAIDGHLNEWSGATAWSKPYIFWNYNGAYLTSTTRAKFAWNHQTNLLYVAIETNEASTKPGGHPVIGVSTGLYKAAVTGIGATQLAFDANLTEEKVDIMNEIDHYSKLGNHYPGEGSGTNGVVAAYSESGGVYTYEIAIPLWENWMTMSQAKTLSVGDTIYVYSMMENTLQGANGTNLTYYGNPGFANANGFTYGSALTLAARTQVAGDANHDGKVDVSDLGILAANYGATSGATWELGDFNGDSKVDVSDLGILAANYGTGTGTTLDFDKDAKAAGLTAEVEDAKAASTLGCGSMGLPLMAGLFLMGLLLVKIEE